jgi:hypothetical protein
VESVDFPQLRNAFSLVDALLKVVNFKRSENQVAGGALLKIPTFHSYGAVFARSCAVESAYFPQLRSVF